jgi:ATP-binding cassette subfamily F protein 3
MVVSHDRVFLERLADHVLHLEDGTAIPYTGGYDAFLEQREARRTLQQKEYERQQAHIARTEEFIRRNLAGQKTKQAKSRRTLLSRMDRIDRPADEARAMGVRFGGGARSGGTVLKLDGVTHSFGHRTLFRPFRAEVMRGERIAIVGPNGSGKSTLMKAIAGVARASRGEIVHGSGVRTAYYRQDFTHLDPKLRVWEAVNEAAPSLGMPALREHLARFLFTNDEIEAKVGDLSGGEQARVALARITLERANVLLLDEPTNHLDIVSREVLEEALERFEGAVLLISHDRALLGALSTRVWAFTPEADGVARIEDYPGGFDDWVEHAAARAVQPAREAAAQPANHTASAPTKSGTPSGLSKNEQRRRQQQLARLEARIAEIEARTAQVEAELADPVLYAAGADPERVRALADERAALEAELEQKYEEWERAGTELAGV